MSLRLKLGALALATAGLTGVLGTVATASIAQAAPLTAPARTAALGTGELRAKLAVAFDVNAARATRAAELETGEAALPTFDRASALMAMAPTFRWDVTGPVTENGDTLTATLFTSAEGYEPWTFPMSWKLIDGTWKLSSESICEIGNFVGTGC
ncbi:hypothetical protein [Nocardia cyriacigeorgica]|uniref:hypothetical protein n=1 Tax=Nocardia cyriacigeorgica TaxID=135487 RepID=UPI0018953238|nr:hypothetical protein [Nocardia cyriacigeorgica]MBF6286127.1 hypothetical protein [Nocardia cyriacigeorgica]